MSKAESNTDAVVETGAVNMGLRGEEGGGGGMGDISLVC